MPMNTAVPRRHDDKARRVVFLKLRKTGGTTLAASVLFPYCIKYGLQYMVPQGWFAVHPRLVPGNRFHMMFRHFPDYPQPWARNWLRRVIGDYQTVTVLREPVARAVSGLNHVVHYLGVKSIEEYFENHHEANHQSHWLGYDGRDDTFLERKFDGVGVTERMNESLLLFRRLLDLQLEDVLYTSVYRDSPKPFSKSDLSEEQVARIRKLDWLDIELHQQATRLVEKRIAESAGLSAELAEFEQALKDFSHPLWGKRGPFQVGFSAGDTWYEFTGQHGSVKQIRPVPP